MFAVLFAYHEYVISLIAAFAAILIGIVSGNSTPHIQVESTMNIMQQGGFRPFSFVKTNSNALSIKNFAEKVNDTLT